MTSPFSRLYESVWMGCFSRGSLTFSLNASYYAFQSDCAVVCLFPSTSFVMIKNAYMVYNKVLQETPSFLSLQGQGEPVAILSRSETAEAQRSGLNWTFIGLQFKTILTKARVPSCLLMSAVQSRNCFHLALTAKFLSWRPNYSLATRRPVHLHISGK